MSTTLLRITPETEPEVPLITRLPVLDDGDERGLTFLLPEIDENEKRRRRKNLVRSLVVDTAIWAFFIWLLTQTPVVQHLQRFVTEPLYLPKEQKVQEFHPKPVILKHETIISRPHEFVKTLPPEVIPPPVEKVIVPPRVPKPELTVKDVNKLFKPVEIATVTPKVAPPKPQRLQGFDVDAAPTVPGREGRAPRAPQIGDFGSQQIAKAVAVVGAKPNVGGFGSAEGLDSGRGVIGGRMLGKTVTTGTGFGSAGDGPGGGVGQYGSSRTYARQPKSAGFGTATAAASPSSAITKTVAATPRTKPPEILEKPKPVYTQAAVNQRIEGEVVLRVILGAAGDVRVLGVIQGLGYGLDQAAEDAARKIKFKPAEQDGHPVDYTAILHITFSLAY